MIFNCYLIYYKHFSTLLCKNSLVNMQSPLCSAFLSSLTSLYPNIIFQFPSILDNTLFLNITLFPPYLSLCLQLVYWAACQQEKELTPNLSNEQNLMQETLTEGQAGLREQEKYGKEKNSEMLRNQKDRKLLSLEDQLFQSQLKTRIWDARRGATWQAFYSGRETID